MSQLRYLLTRIGENLSEKTVRSLMGAIDYLEVGRWMRAKGFRSIPRVHAREALFDLIAAQVGDQRVLYLEFGVYEGASMRYMAKRLTNPNTRFEGFDSFEGLPEDWLPDRQKGHFSLDGAIPQIDDPRVKMFKGWFDATLPGHKFPDHDVLAVNFDADLYTSTIYVLDTIKDMIKPGSYLYFDEWNETPHELRAFNEFLDKTGMTFECLGATRSLQKVLFRRTA